jgi:hypothetical protein
VGAAFGEPTFGRLLGEPRKGGMGLGLDEGCGVSLGSGGERDNAGVAGSEGEVLRRDGEEPVVGREGEPVVWREGEEPVEGRAGEEGGLDRPNFFGALSDFRREREG